MLGSQASKLASKQQRLQRAVREHTIAEAEAAGELRLCISATSASWFVLVRLLVFCLTGSSLTATVPSHPGTHTDNIPLKIPRELCSSADRVVSSVGPLFVRLLLRNLGKLVAFPVVWQLDNPDSVALPADFAEPAAAGDDSVGGVENAALQSDLDRVLADMLIAQLVDLLRVLQLMARVKAVCNAGQVATVMHVLRRATPSLLPGRQTQCMPPSVELELLRFVRLEMVHHPPLLTLSERSAPSPVRPRQRIDVAREVLLYLSDLMVEPQLLARQQDTQVDEADTAGVGGMDSTPSAMAAAAAAAAAVQLKTVPQPVGDYVFFCVFCANWCGVETVGEVGVPVLGANRNR